MYVKCVNTKDTAKYKEMNRDMTYCSGVGCKIAYKCKRHTKKPINETIYYINPPTRLHCDTKQPIPINGCDLFISDTDDFSKVIENDIGV